MWTHTSHLTGTFLSILVLLTPATPKICNIEKKLADIDTMLSDILFKVPGMAVGIVADGETVFQKGYGLRDHKDNRSQVTPRTLFGIGSCSKPFTTYAIDAVINVDDVLSWSDPVMSHIPEFRLRDVTTRNQIKVIDLVTHVSGLPAHKHVVYSSHITRQELLARIVHLEANYDLREKFQYNNLVFAIAGIVLERVTGDSWEDVMRNWVFEPLNMTLTFPSFDHAIACRKEQLSHMELADVIQIAKPHRTARRGSIQSMPWSNDISVAPSLSIVSCVEDMVKWVHEQLSLSGSAKQMYEAQVIIPRGTYLHELDDGETFAYGLGWMLAHRQGRQIVWCGGSQTDGFVSRVVLSPEENLGIVVLTNLESTRHTMSRVIHNLVHRILDILTTDPTPKLTAKDHRTWASQQIIKFLRQPTGQQANRTVEMGKLAVDHAEQYEGVFKNAGYGTVTVQVANSRLVAQHHEVIYILFARKAKDFFTGKSESRGFTFPCSFERDFFGVVSGIRIEFQPGVSPVLFEITPAVDLFKNRYLRAFTGLYENTESFIQISVDEMKFLLLANGAPPYVGELQPRKHSWFRLGDRLFQFFQAENNVPGLRVYEDDQVTVFNRTPATMDSSKLCFIPRPSEPHLRMCMSVKRKP